jgi:tetratricopeptide (TPR) repeat protein
VAVLSAARGLSGQAVLVDAGVVLEELLGHEKHYWQGRAKEAGLFSGRDGLSMAQLSQVAAAGCLLGVSTATELGRRVPGVAVTDAVALWLRELYPPEAGGELGVLRPDRLAELHVSRELGRSAALAQACLTGLDPVQARRALVLLARASGEHPTARSLLESSMARFADVIKGMTAPREVMITIADAIPYPSLALAEAHANISRQVLATYPPGTKGCAQWLNTLAVLLGDLGRREDALAAIDEAVTTYRQLATTRPDAFLPDLAMALNNQSNQLSDLGRREEALAAIDEAVTIRRELAAARPDAFLPNLATALNNQSNRLSDLGRREEALAAIEEAVTTYRQLATTRPDAFLPNLATSLNNQSNRLSGLGRREEALAAIEEAVTIRSQLAIVLPTVFASGYASSLENQAAILSALGREADAQAVRDEATAIRGR